MTLPVTCTKSDLATRVIVELSTVGDHQVPVDRDRARAEDAVTRDREAGVRACRNDLSSAKPWLPAVQLPAPGLAADAMDPPAASMSTMEPRRTEIRPIDPPLYSLAPIGAAAAVTATYPDHVTLGRSRSPSQMNRRTYVRDGPASRPRPLPASIECRPLWLTEGPRPRLPEPAARGRAPPRASLLRARSTEG